MKNLDYRHEYCGNVHIHSEPVDYESHGDCLRHFDSSALLTSYVAIITVEMSAESQMSSPISILYEKYINATKKYAE